MPPIPKQQLEEMADKIGLLLGLSEHAQGFNPDGWLEAELLLSIDILVANADGDWEIFNKEAGAIASMPASQIHGLLTDRAKVTRHLKNQQTWPGHWSGFNPSRRRTPYEELAMHEKGIRLDAELRTGIDALLGSMKPRFLEERALASATMQAQTRMVQDELASADQKRAEAHLNRPAPAPAAQPYGVSHSGAESLVADWMRHLGVLDAVVTRQASDGGIDVDSRTHVAQVKNYAGSVGVDAVRELFGVATSMKKAALFFTSGRFTLDAIAFADALAIPLIHYSAEHGRLNGVNLAGAAVVLDGLGVEV